MKDGPSLNLVRSTTWTLLLKSISTALGFGSSAVLARALGVHEYGVYAFAMAVLGLLQTPTLIGLPVLIVREISAYDARGQHGLIRGLLRLAHQTVVGLSVAFAAMAAIFFFAVRWWPDADVYPTILWMLVLLPLTTLGILRDAILRAFRSIIASQLCDLLVRPILFIGLVLVAFLLASVPLTSAWAMALQVLATALSFLLGLWFLGRHTPTAVHAATPVYESRTWLSSALPLLVLEMMYVVNNSAAPIMLGFLRPPEDVAVYRAAASTGALVAFAVLPVGSVLAPTLSRLYAVRDISRIQRVAILSTIAVLLISLPVAFVLIVFGRDLLGGLFGARFATGWMALVLVSLGHVVNAASGSSDYILNMTGHERDALRAVGVAAGLSIVLNAVLIPLLGVTGAALTTALTTAASNILAAVYVYGRLRVHTSILGVLVCYRDLSLWIGTATDGRLKPGSDDRA